MIHRNESYRNNVFLILYFLSFVLFLIVIQTRKVVIMYVFYLVLKF